MGCNNDRFGERTAPQGREGAVSPAVKQERNGFPRR